MNISPILLLFMGATFAVLYGLVITVGWAITRKNRKEFHQSVGVNEIELYDLQNDKPLHKYIRSVSLSNNHFKDDKGHRIDPENFKCYIVENESSEFSKIKKGYLIFLDKASNKIEYSFDIPNLENYR